MFDNLRTDARNDTTQPYNHLTNAPTDQPPLYVVESASELVDLSQQIANDEVFNREFLPHIESLYNFAYHLTYDDNDADDLVQETLLKAYRSMHAYVVGTNAKAWLFRILKNTFINEYRRRSRQPQQIDPEEIAQYHDSDDPYQGKYLDLRHEIFQDMLGDEVTKALNSIPVDFKTVVLLCDVEGFTYEEMSKILDIPLGTVRSRLNRGRGLLREQLRDYGKQMGYTDYKSGE